MDITTAVINQLGYTDITDAELINTCQDISNHGIDGGFNGFIYHTDTVKFTTDNLDDILQRARDLAEELGEDGAYSLISTFGCLDGYSPDEVADFIAAARIDPWSEDSSVTVLNALAWFAAEEVARDIAE